MEEQRCDGLPSYSLSREAAHSDTGPSSCEILKSDRPRPGSQCLPLRALCPTEDVLKAHPTLPFSCLISTLRCLPPESSQFCRSEMGLL